MKLKTAPLVFVHIPKTAGTTLHKILSQQYARKKTLITSNAYDPLLVEGAQKMKCQFDLIMGHCTVGTHELYSTTKYISCVRDPVKRIVSHYNYARQSPDHYLYDEITKGAMTLADYVGSDLTGELANGMVRHLQGRSETHHETITEDHFERTLENIKKYFIFIGTTERFDESLLILQKILGWKRPYYVRRKVGSYSKDRDSVPESTIKIIKERNEWDIKLFNFINSSLDVHAAKVNVAEFDIELFQKKNASIGKLIFCAREGLARMRGHRSRLS